MGGSKLDNAVEKQPNFAAALSKRKTMHILKLVPDNTAAPMGLNLAPQVGATVEDARSNAGLAQMGHKRWQMDQLMASYQTPPNDLLDDEIRLRPDLVAYHRLLPDKHEKGKDFPNAA